MYFNSLDSDIRIEDAKDPQEEFTPEIVTLEFSESSHKLPIYGYKSVTPDAFLQGQEMVQGQFSVPLTEAKLFKNALDTYTPEEIEDISGLEGVPGIKGTAPIARNLFNISIWLAKTEMQIVDGAYKQVTAGNTVPRFKIIEAKITGYQEGISPDGSATLEFFNFIAKRVV